MLTGAEEFVQPTGGMLFGDVLARNLLFSRSPTTLRPKPGQPSAAQIQIRQGEVHAQALVISC